MSVISSKIFYDLYLRLDMSGIEALALVNEHNQKTTFKVYHSRDMIEEIKKRNREI